MKVKKIMIDGKEISIVESSKKMKVKAIDGEGIVEAYVSIFGNIDAANEIVMPGAFAESLLKKLPKVVWSHNWDEPIGTVVEAREDAKGLFVKFQLVLGVQKGKEAYELLKAGAIDEFSIGYSVDESDMDQDGVRKLKKLSLYEVSPVLVGCNNATELLSVKSAEVEEEKKEIEEKAGRVISGKNAKAIKMAVEKINEIAGILSGLLDLVEEGKSGEADEKKSTSAEAEQETPADKVEEADKQDDSHKSKIVGMRVKDSEVQDEVRKAVKSLNRVLFTIKRK